MCVCGMSNVSLSFLRTITLKSLITQIDHVTTLRSDTQMVELEDI